MTIGGNIWMICLKLNWFFYCLCRMLQFSEFVWALSYSVWDVFNNFLRIDVTDWSKISSDQKRFFIALSLYPLSFFANTPFKKFNKISRICGKRVISISLPRTAERIKIVTNWILIYPKPDFILQFICYSMNRIV